MTAETHYDVEEIAGIQRLTRVVECQSFTAIGRGINHSLRYAFILEFRPCDRKGISNEKVIHSGKSYSKLRTSYLLIQTVQQTDLKVDSDGLERCRWQEVTDAIFYRIE
jgi:hypothetical protein